MGWSGRAPAPPAMEAGKGRERQGARHVSTTYHFGRRSRHRYRQELVPRRRTGQARRDRAATEVVAWPGRSTAGQPGESVRGMVGYGRLDQRGQRPRATAVHYRVRGPTQSGTTVVTTQCTKGEDKPS